ncbi:MAG TPA: ChaB family protein [Azospirillum sp.]|nr:ChaB family protein [Azospirillum sp.]
MPYHRNTELPESVKAHLPLHAQDIYRSAFNNAWQEYDRPETRRAGSREATAHKVAWAAVKRRYEKIGEDWQPKH